MVVKTQHAKTVAKKIQNDESVIVRIQHALNETALSNVAYGIQAGSSIIEIMPALSALSLFIFL